MGNEHIISLIDDNSIGKLNEQDRETISLHTRDCEDCRSAFQAAQISYALMKERAAAEVAPPPFFHARVLANLRERQAANEWWSFARLWKATGVLASSLVATFATLALLTFVVPDTQPVSALSNSYSAEEVILNQVSQAEDVSDGQLLTTIYGGEEEASR